MDELRNVIAEVFEIKADSVKDEQGPDDIEKWDSLGQLKLIGALESHYRIMFETSEIFEIFTVGDIRRLLAKRGIK